MQRNDLTQNSTRIYDDVHVVKSKRKETNLNNSSQVFDGGITVVVDYGNTKYVKITDGVNTFSALPKVGQGGGGGGGDASTLNGQDGAYYRNRSNHTGTQPASTITGLGTAASAASTDFATADQGAKADTALQSFTETDPTVPAHVKSISAGDISSWNAKQNALSVPSQAEVETGTATTARSITAQRIRQGANAAIDASDKISSVQELGVGNQVLNILTFPNGQLPDIGDRVAGTLYIEEEA